MHTENAGSNALLAVYLHHMIHDTPPPLNLGLRLAQAGLCRELILDRLELLTFFEWCKSIHPLSELEFEETRFDWEPEEFKIMEIMRVLMIDEESYEEMRQRELAEIQEADEEYDDQD